MEKKENLIQVIEEKEITDMYSYSWLSLNDLQKSEFVEEILLNLIKRFKVRVHSDYISNFLSIGAIYDIMGCIAQVCVNQYEISFEVLSCDSFIVELVD